MVKGAWWVDSPVAVATLAAAGFSLYIIPDITDAQLDATLDAVPPGHYPIVLLRGDAARKEATVRRLKGRNFFGYITHDEPNVGGTLLGVWTQQEYYETVKRIDPWKQVLASYHVEPWGMSSPNFVARTPRYAWDYVLLNYYPATWGVSDEQAAANLRSATAAARAFFPSSALILPIQQAAGRTSVVNMIPGQTYLRPIPGLLQAQADIWRASGLQTVDAFTWYGWGTNPENWNLHDPAVLAEAAAVR